MKNIFKNHKKHVVILLIVVIILLIFLILSLTGHAKTSDESLTSSSTATPAPEVTATPTPEVTATPTPVATATPQPVQATPQPTAVPQPAATAVPQPEQVTQPDQSSDDGVVPDWVDDSWSGYTGSEYDEAVSGWEGVTWE